MKSKIIKSPLTFSCFQFIHNHNNTPYPKFTAYIDEFQKKIHQKYERMKKQACNQSIYCYFRMNLSNNQIMDYLDPERLLYKKINISRIYTNLIKVELISSSLLSYNITVKNYHKLSLSGLCRPFIFQIQNEENKNDFFIYKSSMVIIKNLNSDLLQPEMTSLLKPFGQYQIIFFPIKKNTRGRSKNIKFIFIKFKNHLDAWQCAILFQNVKLLTSIFGAHVCSVVELYDQIQQKYRKQIYDENMEVSNKTNLQN